MPNVFDQFDAAPAAPIPGQAGQAPLRIEVTKGGTSNVFDQFDGGAGPTALPAAPGTAPGSPSVFNSMYGNVLEGAQQRSSPHVGQYGEPISTDVFQNDAGEVQFRDKSGQLVPTDTSKHVVLTGPEGSPAVFARNPETNESPVVGASRVLTLGLGSSAPTTGAAVAASGATEATVPALKNISKAVYNDPAILNRPVTPQMVGTAFRQAAPQLRTFPTDVQDQIISSMRMRPRSPNAGITIGDLDNASKRLGHLADETQMTAGGPKPTPTAAAASIIKGKVDDLMRQLAPEFVTADANYGAAKTAETLSGRADKAQVLSRGGDFSARMQTQATQLLANPKYLRAFKPEEVEQLKQISEGTMSGDALRELNARLGGKIGAIVGGIAGAPGGIVGTAIGAVVGATGEAIIGKVLTGLGNRLTAGQVDRLSSVVRARSPLGQDIAQRTADWQSAFDQLKAAPTQAKLTTLATTARNLATSLGMAGVKVRPAQFLQQAPMIGHTEDNEHGTPRLPAK